MTQTCKSHHQLAFVTLVTVILLSVVPTVSDAALTVVPANFTGSCPQASCSMLNNLIHYYQTLTNDSLDLSLLPGEHQLNRSILLSGLTHVHLTNICNSSQCNNAVVDCQGIAGFRFEHIQSIIICRVTFIGCSLKWPQGNRILGGALVLTNVINITILESCFFGNYITQKVTNGYGGAIYIDHSRTVIIRGSSFMNNSAWFGGAMTLVNCSVLISECHFHNNSGSNGGVIYTRHTEVTFSKSYFSHNSAVIQSAVNAENCSLFISECTFVGNSAVSWSVLYANNSDIISVNSLYSENWSQMKIKGAFFFERSTFTSNNSIYTENSGLLLFGSDSKSYCFNNTYERNFYGAISCICSSQETTESDICEEISINNIFLNNTSIDSSIVTSFGCTSHDIGNQYVNNTFMVRTHRGKKSLFITRSTYSGNLKGGITAVNAELISITWSRFQDNGAFFGALMIFNKISNLTISHSNFSNNVYGGGVLNVKFSLYGSGSIMNCYFTSNRAYLSGAIYIYGGIVNVSLRENVFTNNRAEGGSGGAVYFTTDMKSILTISYCRFQENFAHAQAGAVNVLNGAVSCLNSKFIRNKASLWGGSMYILDSTLNNSDCFFNGNSAKLDGGAIYVLNSTIISMRTAYETNSCKFRGGVIFGNQSTLLSYYSWYITNRADRHGGALYVRNSSVSSFFTLFMNNTSFRLGGALYSSSSELLSTNDTFSHNHAIDAGGGIAALSSSVHLSSDLFLNNIAGQYGGAVYIDSCSKPPKENVTSMLVRATIFFSEFVCTELKEGGRSVSLQMTESLQFMNNSCSRVGGAVITVTTHGMLTGMGVVFLSRNAANSGGGVASFWSNMTFASRLKIESNHAGVSGGGLFSYQSDISIASSTFSLNKAIRNGGGVYGIASQIKIVSQNSSFMGNSAHNGGAVYFSSESKLILLQGSQLFLTENEATKGGAIFIQDAGTDRSNCVKGNVVCFLQSIVSNNLTTKISTDYFNIIFNNNSASMSGADLFGGLLDRCYLSPSNQLIQAFPKYSSSNGIDYIRATAQFVGLADYSNLSVNYDPDRVLEQVSVATIAGLVSSDPVQVCYCFQNKPNCTNLDHPVIRSKRGSSFNISVTAVDQTGNLVNATVISSVLSSSGPINIDHTRQLIPADCTSIMFTLYPEDESGTAQFELFADGPCQDISSSKRILNVIFEPCTCPIGFVSKETQTQCNCVCDPVLAAYISGCSLENQTVFRNPNVWIDFVNTSSQTGYLLYQDCPFDYCINEAVSVNLNKEHGADSQCAFNRSGRLCGACGKSLSAVLGSSNCRQCSNNYISLILPFAAAGITLVVFIMVFNMTVTSGTINGLIFYANIVFANRSLFIPPQTPQLFVVFISWLNLDLGIETCFYNRLDSYAKILLLLAFPAYVILLTVGIIILSEYSIRFSTFIGKRWDPVGTLCTLILLSYSKFIRTIIASLQFTYLNHPDGSREIVWLYNANVPYFTPSHSPRFIAAALIIILGAVYTTLLLFGQCLPKCGERMLFRWVNNPKYNDFIAKYHTRLQPKHRYWVGLLLLARFSHYIASSFISESAALFSVLVIVFVLLAIKHLSTRLYSNPFLDNLESAFLVNLGLIAAALFCIEETNGDKTLFSSLSLAFSFLLFLMIISYHVYDSILKNTLFWERIVQLLRALWNRIRHILPPHNRADEEQEEIEMNLRVFLLQELPYPESESDEEHEDRHYDPPVIQPAVRYSQPRNRDLEELFEPITEQDYRQMEEPRRQLPQPVTYSVVEINPHDEPEQID